MVVKIETNEPCNKVMAKNQFPQPEKMVKQPYEYKDKREYFDSLGYHKLSDGYLTLKTEGELGKTFTKKLGRTATKQWLKRWGNNYDKSVQQAISEGKIKSHPDYPELS